MAQTCRVCAHPKTRAMEKAYVNGRPKTRIAKKYGVPSNSVDYHMDNHLPDKLVRSVQQKELDHTENILSGIKDLLDRTKDILDKAEEKGQKRLALDAIKEARSTYELLSKIAVKLEEYRRADEEKETGAIERQVSQGLEALSDAELKTFIQLQAKIYAANPDYELDTASRYIVESYSASHDEVSSYPKKSEFGKSDSPYEHARQVRNSLKKQSESELDLELDDLNFDDLDLDENELNNTIPSEKSDPKWLREERRRRRRGR